MAKAVASTDWKAKAKHAASTLKSEYEAGKRGDDGPSATIWATPAEQLDAFVALLGRTRAATADKPSAPLESHPADHDQPGPAPALSDQAAEMTEADQADVAELTTLMGGIDWAGVRTATAARTTETAQAVRTLAGQVDWAAVQPVAAQASSALIAAVATGQLPVGGRIGSMVARAMIDQGGLGQRLGRQVLADQSAARPELRQVIDVVDSIVKGD